MGDLCCRRVTSNVRHPGLINSITSSSPSGGLDSCLPLYDLVPCQPQMELGVALSGHYDVLVKLFHKCILQTQREDELRHCQV